MGLGSLVKGIGKAIGVVGKVAGAVTGNPLFTIGSNIVGGLWQNNQASAAAQKQMDFQRYMSNTSYQRATEDMRLAGLNPALAYSQGGASTPMGASYTPQNVAKDATTAGLAHTAQMAQLQNVAADTRNKDVMTDKIRADTANTNANTAKVIAENNKRDVMGRLWDIGNRALDSTGNAINQVRKSHQQVLDNQRREQRRRIEFNYHNKKD